MDEALLDRFRQPGRCEHCGKTCSQGRDPHHAEAKGMGGGKRLDIEINLVSLCRQCHDDVHAGRIDDANIWAYIAMREGPMQHTIREIIWEILRTERHKVHSLSAAAKRWVPAVYFEEPWG